MKKILMAIAILCLSFAVRAQAPDYKPYVISGLLKANAPTGTMKLVQTMLISDSAQNAQLTFTILVTKQFADFTIVDVLSSPLEVLVKAIPTPTQSKAVEPNT